MQKINNNSKNKKGSIFFAILAALLYAINAPFSKLLLEFIPPTMLAGFLYLGAGIGMIIIKFFRRTSNKNKEESLNKSDLPNIIAMIILDILAPIFLMIGLSSASAANVSLLNNFEIVATSIIAMMIFKEHISKKLWLSIALVTIASIILSVDDISSLKFSSGSLFVISACISWGFENNCTRNLSSKDPLDIVMLKGLFSGLGALIISIFIGEKLFTTNYIFIALLLGFVSYGLSIYFYIYAQRFLGAAKTSTYYAIAPFIGTLISLLVFKELPSLSFIIALIIMILGVKLAD